MVKIDRRNLFFESRLISQNFLNFWKDFLFQNLMFFKFSDSKPDGWWKIWFKFWFSLKFLNRKLFFFTKNISLRMKHSKTAQNCQLCCFYTERWSTKWVFKANFPINVEFQQKLLLQNLMHCRSFDLNSDGRQEGWSEIRTSPEILVINWTSCWKLTRNQTRFNISDSNSDALWKID